jgi:hypothetical protein
LAIAVVVAQDAAAQETPPPPAQAYVGRCSAYINKTGEGDRAIADSTQAIQLRSEICAGLQQPRLAYRAKGDNDRAIADHTEAIWLDPRLARA